MLKDALLQMIERVVCYSVENHPADSRVNLDESGEVQTLTSRMGTGGGNVPMVMTPFRKSTRAKSADDATVCVDGDVANTLNTFDQGETRCNELVVEEIAAPRHHDGVVIAFDRAAYNQGENAQYDFEVTDNGVTSTIVAKGPSGVCYSSVISSEGEGDIAGTLDASYCKGTGERNGKERTVVAIDTTSSACVVRVDSCSSALQARDGKGGKAVLIEDKPHYIVRRLTPTECARLQGFPDKWGHPDRKDEITAEEYEFWREVRMTYDRINGRKEKYYTDAQILKWYNSLHNDGAEYKMWGNGIALPCALFIMRNIANK